MTVLQELSPREIKEVLAAAAAHNVPVTLTVRQDGHWANLHSQIIGVHGPFVLLSPPTADFGWRATVAPGSDVGVSLKLKHHKYIFPTLAAQGLGPGPDICPSPALVLDMPAKMQRLQRRAYIRAAVPDGCVVRAAFWMGGRQAEPAGASPDRPVGYGRVINLSAGGFQLRTSDESARLIEPGFVFGLRLLFGAGLEAVFADAVARHVLSADAQATVGFQFLGLEQTDEGKAALRLIAEKVAEYQHRAPRSRIDQPVSNDAETVLDAQD
jgi:c-di-GMP-binding flagellar brake protein YcgR